jgi:hypothetical protein
MTIRVEGDGVLEPCPEPTSTAHTHSRENLTYHVVNVYICYNTRHVSRLEAGYNTSAVFLASRKRRQKGNPVHKGINGSI